MMVGNVATKQAARDLILSNKVDAIKVGIGPGAVCSTRERTGFGVPQLSAIIEVAEEAEGKVTIVADGGIRNSGDIVKALAAGADSVMIGRLFAGASESPMPGMYWGMASRRVNGHNAPEGIEGTVPLTGPVSVTIKELTWGIKSGISYGGGSDIETLRRNAKFRIVTPSSLAESRTRV